LSLGAIAEEARFDVVRRFGSQSQDANFVDLSSIASVGSAVSLLVFLLIGLAGWRRRADTGSNAAIVLAAIGVIAVVLAFFFVDTIKNDPWSVVAVVAITVVAFVLDALFRRPGRDATAVTPAA
jgi:Na+/proline symporter